MNASLTAGTFLLTGGNATTAYSKLVDITEYPDVGSTVDSQDVTTLSDACHKYIDALPDPGGAMEFSGWLNETDYDAVMAISGTEVNCVIAFGGSASDSDASVLVPDEIKGVPGSALTITPVGDSAATFLAVAFKAKIRIRLTGAGTDAARPVSYTVVPTTGFTDQDGNML